MKYLTSLVMGLMFVTPFYVHGYMKKQAYAEDNKKQLAQELAKQVLMEESKKNWSNFYKVKGQIKDVVEKAARSYPQTKFTNQIEAETLRMTVIHRLVDLREELPFKFNVFYAKPSPQGGQIVPDLVLTIAAKYEDQLGKITWGFNVAFYDYKIEFYSVNKFPIQPGEAYNYLTLYKA